MYAQTRSYVARPSDSRCRYWAKLVTPENCAGVRIEAVEGAEGIPAPYLRKGADIEIPIWGAIVEGEEEHHRKARGWKFAALLAVPRESKKAPGEPALIALPYGAEQKKIIKRLRPELAAGSGEHAAIMRSLIFVVGAPTDSDLEREARLLALEGGVSEGDFSYEVYAQGQGAVADWLSARGDPRGERLALAIARGWVAA